MANISYNDIAKAIYIGSKNKDNQEMSLFVDNTVKFLTRKKLLSKSKNILDKLETLLNNEKGLVKAKVSTAEKMNDVLKKELNSFLLKKYNAKEVDMMEIVDSKYIGGVKIEVDDEVIDLTIFNKLKKLQTHLTR
jgi:F-type H+-transporting ATPase subunit delta